MRRGTRVGNAYVALGVDGSGINKDIADEVDKAGPEVERSGEEHGERYGEGFDSGLHGRLGRIRENLAKGLRRRMERDGSEAGETYTKGLSRTFDKAGSRIGKSLGSSIVDAMTEKIDSAIGSIGRMFDTLDQNTKGGSGPSAPRGKYAPPPIDQRRLEQAYRMNEQFNRRRSQLLEAAHRMDLAFDRKRTVMLAQAYKMNAEFDAGKRDSGGYLIPSGGGKEAGIGGLVGGILGAGSRNNFLNLFGRSMGGLVKMADKLRSAIGSMFSTFMRGFNSAEQGASFVQKALSGMSETGMAAGKAGGGAMASLAKSGPAAAVAIAAVTAGMTILVSVASALLAIVVALASTIVSALVGALAVASGGVLALAAAGGLLVNAFTSMTDAQRTLLKDAFTPLKEEMTGIGQIMIRQMVPAFGIWSANLQRAASLLIPLADVMGGAFARAGTQLTASFSGPGFQKLTYSLGVYLPGIVTKMSKALGGFLNGAAGLFAALLPSVDRFASYLTRVADRFSNWANSAAGQNAISDFVDRAIESLTSLWNFSREFFGFIFDLLFSEQAQGAGNSLFDSMAKSFEGFRKKLQKWIDNGDLEDWFDDAIEFAKDFADAMQSIWKILQSLNSSGVLQVVGDGIKYLGKAAEYATAPIKGQIAALEGLIAGVSKAASWLGIGGGGGSSKPGKSPFAESITSGLSSGISSALDAVQGATQAAGAKSKIDKIIKSGKDALDATAKDHGGNLPKPKKTFFNPYKKWALSLVKEGSSTANQIKKALREANRQISDALRDASRADSASSVNDAMRSLAQSINTTARNTVDSARQALNNAATTLANAASMKAAKAALKKVRQAQKDLRKAKEDQARINKVAALVDKQGAYSAARVNKALGGLTVSNMTKDRVAALLKNLKTQNLTLADFAEARSRVADMIEAAKRKLEEAIQLRDNYKTQVAESIKAFGALTTAQAKVIDGVEQALTANDITSNLEDRLAQIRKFQQNLQVLLSMGLSNAAYQQIVDMGVADGSAYAEALVKGGVGAVSQVNDLTDQIGKVADSLADQASNRLYQAGVDAAQGLVDGLNSLSDQLDAAAYKLGTAIAKAVKNALGIKSPSKVMDDMMDYVGDGGVNGLDRQHSKLRAASQRFAAAIAPTVAAATAAGRSAVEPVSGNSDNRFRDLVINTPTQDPYAVANEVLNEVTARL